MVRTKRMDKLEYIPGDFVTIETVSTKPRVVKVSDVNEDSVIYCEGWGEVCFYDEIKPIPLTKDILLRNGWKVSRDSLLLKIDDNVTLGIVFAFNHKVCYIRATNDIIHKEQNFARLKLSVVDFVSDLQHVLFGIGLDSNIII